MLYQQHKRENDDAEPTIASCTQTRQKQTTPETKKIGTRNVLSKHNTGEIKDRERKEITAAAWLIDEENSQNPNPNPNLDFTGNDVTLPNFIVNFKCEFEIVLIHKCS
jgi:hypothetical protein